MDVMDFFRLSQGQWNSQRTTHHLPFRRAELGGSTITVEALDADHPRVIEICELHEVDPATAVGGASVVWKGAMAWDRDDENHEGSTIFALVPDPEKPSRRPAAAGTGLRRNRARDWPLRSGRRRRPAAHH